MKKSKGNNNWVTYPNYRWIDNFKSLLFIIIEIEIISNKYFFYLFIYISNHEELISRIFKACQILLLLIIITI